MCMCVYILIIYACIWVGIDKKICIHIYLIIFAKKINTGSINQKLIKTVTFRVWQGIL